MSLLHIWVGKPDKVRCMNSLGVHLPESTCLPVVWTETETVNYNNNNCSRSTWSLAEDDVFAEWSTPANVVDGDTLRRSERVVDEDLRRVVQRRCVVLLERYRQLMSAACIQTDAVTERYVDGTRQCHLSIAVTITSTCNSSTVNRRKIYVAITVPTFLTSDSRQVIKFNFTYLHRVPKRVSLNSRG